MDKIWMPKLIVPGQPKKEFIGGGCLNGKHLKNDVPIAEVQRIVDAIVISCQFLTHCFHSMGMEVTFDASELVQNTRNPDRCWTKPSGYAEPVLAGKYQGILTKEHILTIATICYRYFAHPNDIAIWGACQGAKTIVYAFCFILLPALEKLVNNRIAVPIITVPDSKNLSISARKELQTLLNLYGQVKVRLGDVSVPLSYIETDILNRIESEKGTSCNWNALVLQRNRSNIEHFTETIVGQGDTVVVINFLDEIHLGSAKKSVVQEMERTFLPGGTQRIYRRIGISATLSEIWGSPAWIIVPIWMPDVYLGLTQYNGRKLPNLSGKPNRVQEIKAIEDEFPNLDVDRDKFINVEHFFREEFRGRLIEEGRLVDEDTEYYQLSNQLIDYTNSAHLAYRYNFAEEIFRIYKSLVTPEHNIMFLRAFARMQDSHILIKLLENIARREGNDNYKLLPYFDKLDPVVFGDHKKHEPRSLKEVLIDDYVSRKHFCMVIAANGRSRMGDSYPRQAAHFMDLVEHSVTWDAILQSSFGRAGGFNKVSVCYFRRDYCDELRRFIANGCHDRKKKFCSRHDYIDKDGKVQKKNRGAPSKHTYFCFDAFKPEEDLK